MFFDTHCHYDFKQYNEDRDRLLGEILPKFGMDYVLNVGTTMKSSRESIALAKKYDYIYTSIGFHPHNAKEMKPGDLALLEEMTKEPKVVAVGEIGLDFHYNHSPKDIQRKVFADLLDLALKANLPVIVHSRDANDEVFKILAERRIGEKVGGVVHCFSGTADLAKKYVDIGFYIGIGGVVTYKNAEDLRKTVENIPLENLVLETDCPYLSPEPFRGKRNESPYISYIAEVIAEIKNETAENILAVTNENAKKLFGFS